MKIFLAGAGVIAALTLPVAVYFSSIEDLEVEVTGRERVNIGESSVYRVYTETETFENKDDPLFLKFNSADVQGHMKDGATCQVKVIGWRIPMLSSFRNILQADCQ